MLVSVSNTKFSENSIQKTAGSVTVKLQMRTKYLTLKRIIVTTLYVLNPYTSYCFLTCKRVSDIKMTQFNSQKIKL